MWRLARIAALALAPLALVALAVMALVPRPWWMEQAGRPPSPYAVLQAIATGFFVTPDGWVLTDRRAVAGCASVGAGSAALPGRTADHVIVPLDATLDLALVHLREPAPAVLRLAGGGAREAAFVVGFARDGRTAAPTRLADARTEEAGALDLAARLPPETGGSPVLDAQGDVLAVVTAPDAPAGPRAVEAARAAAFLREAVPAARPAAAATGPDPGRAILRVFCFRTL